ncbi:MAG: hypothetical protein EPO08_10610 [Rhodospirillaceae bacterium]|nr:MAG: hypothetical protein EPO08_10610 [Rhodospirillaceae bacterium]
MRLKLGESDPILIDVEALRRVKSDVAIDLTRAPSSRKDMTKEAGKAAADAITVDMADPLAAIIALARRKTRR